MHIKIKTITSLGIDLHIGFTDQTDSGTQSVEKSLVKKNNVFQTLTQYLY